MALNGHWDKQEMDALLGKNVEDTRKYMREQHNEKCNEEEIIASAYNKCFTNGVYRDNN